MDYQTEYSNAAIAAVLPHLEALPEDVRSKVNTAAALIRNKGCIPSELLREELGGANWVIARRTRRIVEQYGPDVVCVTPKRYQEAERRAIARMVPAPGADLPGNAGSTENARRGP